MECTFWNVMTGRMQFRKQGEDGHISRENVCSEYCVCGWNAHLDMIVSLEYPVEYTSKDLVLFFKLDQLKINYPSEND